MRFKIFPIGLLLIVATLVSACSSNPTMEATEALGSDADQIQLLVYAEAEPNADGTTAGDLELTITFENPSENEVTLDLTASDYKLLTSDGFEFEPTTLSDSLQNPTIPAGSSVAGTADYTVESAIRTYTLSVTGFESVTVDAAANTTAD